MKNYKRVNQTMRSGFSMLTAIFVIVLLATVSALIVTISGKTVKATSFQYKKEQAILYAKSYTELAIMAASANDAQDGTNCVETITGSIGLNPVNGDGFDIITNISYIGNNLQCSASRIVLPAGTVITDSVNGDTIIQIVIDVFVRYKDPDAVDAMISAGTSTVNAPWITFHRRTLQKL